MIHSASQKCFHHQKTLQSTCSSFQILILHFLIRFQKSSDLRNAVALRPQRSAVTEAASTLIESVTKCRLMVSEGTVSAYSSTIIIQAQLCQSGLPLPPSLLPPLWSILTFFFVSTLFLFLLFASRPSILPLLMWQAWEMKSWNFMSGNEEHLLFFFFVFFFHSFACKRGQKRKKKKKIIWEANTMTQSISFNKWRVACPVCSWLFYLIITYL